MKMSENLRGILLGLAIERESSGLGIPIWRLIAFKPRRGLYRLKE